MDTWGGEGARFKLASDQSLLVYFEQPKEKGQAKAPLPQNQERHRSEDRPLQTQFSLQANENVRKLLRLLELEPVAGVRNLHPAYCSLLIKFDALRMGHDELETILRRYLERLVEVKLPEPRHVEIPVSYGGGFCPDFAEVRAMDRKTTPPAIGLHSSAACSFFYLGLLLGFAYPRELSKMRVTPLL